MGNFTFYKFVMTTESAFKKAADVDHDVVQLCTSICQVHSGNHNAKKLLEDGSKLLRQAFGLWDVFLKPDSGYSDAINLCWYVPMLRQQLDSSI
jgi:hypothetical protein